MHLMTCASDIRTTNIYGDVVVNERAERIEGGRHGVTARQSTGNAGT
jgi:hypothetical protein